MKETNVKKIFNSVNIYYFFIIVAYVIWRLVIFLKRFN